MDTMLTPRQVADQLNVSIRTVYVWIEQGRLPAVRLSERVTRVPQSSLAEFLGAGMTAGSSQPASVVAEVPTRCSACREGETPLATLAPGASSAAARLRRLLEAHRDEILRIASRRRACNVRVFGSVARGDARENSDVDLLVDLEPHASLFDLGGLNGELEELLGVKVDVVPVGSLKPHVRARALAEATPL